MARKPSRKPYYECQRCGACCKWPGDVKIEENEVAPIAEYLGLSEIEFIEKYTRLRQNRKGLSLIEKANHECILLSRDNVCMINEVKPLQCQGFPNQWSFKGWRNVCEAKEVQPS